MKIKSLISVIMSLLMIFSLTSCTQTLNNSISADGSVDVVTEMLLTKDEYNQIISMGGEPTTDPDTEITDVVIDGVEYKKFSETKKYKTISEFKENALTEFTSEINTNELWFISKGNNTSDATTPSETNIIFTMPYRIDRTNGTEISEYTVEFNSIEHGKCYYLTTENSVSEWTKAEDIEKELNKEIFNQTKVVNFKFTPTLNSDLKSVKLVNKSGYIVMNNVNYFESGYKLSYLEIYRKTNNGNFSKIGTRNLKTPIEGILYTDKTVKPNKKYTYKIRGVFKENDLIKYSSFSSAKAITIKPKAPALSSVKSIAKKTAKITWKKVSGVTGYQIYRSTKKNSGYKRVKTITKTSTKTFLNKKLKSKKTYYYKLRSFKVVNNKRVYSDFSTIKKIKIK